VSITKRTIVAYGAVILVAIAASGPAPAATAVHTKQQAELNILRSPGFFWRAGLHGFIRSQTMTFRTNVTVSCGGGKGTPPRAHVFLCVVSYRDKVANIRYTALGKYAFKIQIAPHRG
jgi:hypothetical protein